MEENVVIVECISCGEKFVIPAEEKEWYEKKGFELPKRCKSCRQKRRNNGRKRN